MKQLFLQVPFAPQLNETATEMVDIGLAMLNDGDRVPEEYLAPNDCGNRPSFVLAVLLWQLDVHYELFTNNGLGEDDVTVLDSAQRLIKIIELRRLVEYR